MVSANRQWDSIMNSIQRSQLLRQSLVAGARGGALTLSGALTLGGALVLGGAVWATSPGSAAAVGVKVPQALVPPAGQSLTLSTHATGVQIYVCAAAQAEPTRFAWIFKAPEATLRDSSHRLLGRHYAGPTWEAVDGSKVVGELVAKADAPIATAIPWLLLRAKSTSGSGTLGRITSIQRLDTVGGVAPDTGCDAARAGALARIKYSAEYRFFVETTKG